MKKINLSLFVLLLSAGLLSFAQAAEEIKCYSPSPASLQGFQAPMFAWSKVADAGSYQIEVYKIDPEKKDELFLGSKDLGRSQNFINGFAGTLLPGEYRWKVFAYNLTDPDPIADQVCNFKIMPATYFDYDAKNLKFSTLFIYGNYRSTSGDFTTTFSLFSPGFAAEYNQPIKNDYSGFLRALYVTTSVKNNYFEISNYSIGVEKAIKKPSDESYDWGVLVSKNRMPQIVQVDYLNQDYGYLNSYGAGAYLDYKQLLREHWRLKYGVELQDLFGISSSVSSGISPGSFNYMLKVPVEIATNLVWPWNIGAKVEYSRTQIQITSNNLNQQYNLDSLGFFIDLAYVF